MRPLAIAIAMLTAGGVRADADLVFGTGKDAARVRMRIVTDGRKPDSDWNDFLDKLFDYFDRDADGFLSRAEAGRVFLLPLSEAESIRMDFAKMDANRDGKVIRTEFKTFYRHAGFTPVVATVAEPDIDRIRAGETLFRFLDRDGDGRLSRTELESAPALLKRLDIDEDDVLSLPEILVADRAPPLKLEPNARSGMFETPDAELRIVLDRSQPLKLELSSGKFMRLTGSSFQWPGNVCRVASARRSTFTGTQQFYLSIFRDALGDRKALDRESLAKDPTHQILDGVFAAADRNGDGSLTADEMDRFMALIEMGVSSQTFVTVVGRGRNLFDLFDANDDSRLDLGELSKVCATLEGNTWSRNDFPARHVLTVGRSRTSKSLGPVRLSRSGTRTAETPVANQRGPAWFRAMDSNGDGYVSPREFIGSPELLRKIDLDGDGRINTAEADNANSTTRTDNRR